MKRMSEQEQKFAAEHHTIVYRFLHYYHLPVEEYYDVVIMRYLNAVQRYLNRLELQQYSFTTIAWQGMKSAVWNYRKRESRNKPAVSLDLIMEVVQELAELPLDKTEEKMLIDRLLSDELSFSQKQLLKRRLQGYSNTETAEWFGVSDGNLSACWQRILYLLRETQDEPV